MINPGLSRYEVVLDNKYFLRDLVESITLEESLDEIAYRATVRLVVTPDFPGITPGQEIRVSGIPFGGTEMVYLLHPGVVWEVESESHGQKHITVTIYDKTIYLAKSEDEYILPAGQTASQRIERYAADWNIPLGNIADTGIPLVRAVYRAQSIYSMMMADLKETATKGGGLYRPRMTPYGLELVQLGSNETVWVLESGQNVESLVQRRTLEGTVTAVKVLGTAKKARTEIDTSGMTLEEIGRLYGSEEDREDLPSPVLAIEYGENDKYGTLQKVIQDSKIETVAQAIEAARKALTGMQETLTVTAIDINTIRAGDKVSLDGWELLVTSVKHDLGSPGHMTLELASEDYVRRRYYYD
ncbi:hypothetical protein SAMN00808754_2036 [Thermanaeromonas toyohensis ToBE]|uniref:YqbQ/XkdQ domain-containing protein n=1 Tax=Thermanaeromonas toyohensis ToBE TaxID=698762 RepID=A0A1W1VX54_9FIRM|nr:phage portal protein [Thermanaeromonas toyohensis]SMB97935.1 hypothetical protein SAMN00808754_2036 [Thermanaeromonas toyohensis ToBE]